MSFDLSRKIFNPLEDYLGVVMQQGRVQTDADWNTLVAQFKRRLQAGSLDTFGPSAVPRETADGFLITGSATDPEIGAGRLYVDGLLAENHTETLKWDARLAETSGTARLSGARLDAAPTGPAGTTPYTDQPYFPDPPALPADETTLLYVDVWQRDITYLQDAGLVDAAVGVDTTARQQTVWQVKGLTGVGDIDAGTPDVDIPGWLQ
ncbi:MAG TPA: right-handed parallel beta-helix repeat-containing protein, partial [Gammaproteobacteria bacterium]|nr:right-handed parallel beta-helix repeat-containing protein [Gammaproteobacteria bacterium]